MKIIKYISLFKYLIEDEGLNPMSAYRNIQRIRMLPPEFKQAVFEVLSSYVPDMEIGGVSFRELTENDGMKPISAILMLDWLRREPAVAIRYMATERYRSVMVGLPKQREVEKITQEDIIIED